MTRIDFHYNAPDRVEYVCRLVRKVYRTGARVVVCCDDAARLSRFDQALWTFSQLDFIPHVMASDRLAGTTPVVLTVGAAELPHHEVLVNLGEAAPSFFASFERLIEVVGTDPADRETARSRFRFYKDRGYPLVTHDLSAGRAGGDPP